MAAVGSKAIGYARYRHWGRIVRLGSPRASNRSVRRQTMKFLIMAEWVIGEAHDRGIKLTPQQVTAKWERERHAAFRSAAEFEQYLRSTGQTRTDSKYRMRVQMLSERLQPNFSPRDFLTKWRARTRCSPAYFVSECGSRL